jgi:hypothetical protein
MPPNQPVAFSEHRIATGFFSAAYIAARNCQKLSGGLKGLPGHISGNLRPA